MEGRVDRVSGRYMRSDTGTRGFGSGKGVGGVRGAAEPSIL